MVEKGVEESRASFYFNLNNCLKGFFFKRGSTFIFHGPFLFAENKSLRGGGGRPREAGPIIFN